MPSEELKRWYQWLEELPKLENVHLPRCETPPNFGAVSKRELHHFSDASSIGYGTVSYLRQVNSNGGVHCTLLFGKSRVAPLKKITIPLMELTTATMAVKMNKIVNDALKKPVDKVYFWTDSMSVIRYIANERTRFQTFVANRIAIIRDATSVKQWRYVGTKHNPADYASRGLCGKDIESNFWFTGPDFLLQSEDQWPRNSLDTSIDPDDIEVKVPVYCSALADTDFITRCYSSFRRARAIMAWILIL